MIHFSAEHNDIVEDFINHGISIDRPGFYDDPEFIKIERRNNKFLCNYARYVQTKQYSEEYLKNAYKIIPYICKLLYNEFLTDSKPGECINISMILSKILEKEGFWNYIVKGALTINFPIEANITPKFFWPVDIYPVDAGHAWVVAPPFNVIDLTVKIQQYYENEEEFLPDYVIEDKINIGEITYQDIYSPECRRWLRNRGVRNSEMLKRCNPDVIEFSNVFKPNIIKYKGTELKYIPVACSASDAPLEKMKNLCINGMYPIDIYRKVILPNLNKIKTV
ncbi:hypothetical protein SAMN02745135_02555 [Caloranaerobacter azorensis DSM 13643]|uniref:Uncharacterized protein n=1 Tax=Caloranaerobacter azorensis DSM 13643 TaxID=1121264 RepID=A0A1M5WMN6_9FIRM|nr:hypothetical protein [Caloranaerobacter azorensis]SHH88739.1 hypothetical protein SAMN02745135_02555 [Caloranaerobacter azorensis DSM 13643]